VFLEGELPEALTTAGGDGAASLGVRCCQLHAALETNEENADAIRDHLGRLQARFDQEAEEFAAEGAELKRQGDAAGVQRQASLFMDHSLEMATSLMDELFRLVEGTANPAPSRKPDWARQPT
jgi:hypothetical protein